MSTQSPIEYLETLRANLRHFEENQDFGDFFTVQKIRQMLEKQIAEAESVLVTLSSYGRMSRDWLIPWPEVHLRASTKPFGRAFRGDVALWHAQHLKANHEFPHRGRP